MFCSDGAIAQRGSYIVRCGTEAREGALYGWLAAGTVKVGKGQRCDDTGLGCHSGVAVPMSWLRR
jgi:hypothetical protein